METKTENKNGWLVFLTLAGIVTLVSITIYTVAQQVYRNSANDPQIEASEAISDIIKQGAPPEAITGQNSVEIEKSLSLFINIYDKDGKFLAGSGKLGAENATPPKSLFEQTNKKGSSLLTWQPKSGVRVATSIKKLEDDKGYVLVGKNIREVEKRIKQLGAIVAISWALLIVMCAALTALLRKFSGQVSILNETEIVSVEMKK